jgi:hypothetical protein
MELTKLERVIQDVKGLLTDIEVGFALLRAENEALGETILELQNELRVTRSINNLEARNEPKG